MNTFNVISGTAGIAGVLITIFTIFYSRRVIRLSYTVKDTELLGGSNNILPGEVQVFFNGSEISDLKKFNYLFWNSGNIEIKRDLIPSTAPISLVFADGTKILKASIVKFSADENRATVNFDMLKPNIFYIDFEFLNPNQGFNVEVFYTEVIENYIVKGVIIGSKKPIDYIFTDKEYKKMRAKISNAVNLTCCILFFGAFGIVAYLMRKDSAFSNPFLVFVYLSATGTFGMFFSAIITSFISSVTIGQRYFPKEIDSSS